MLDLWGVWGTLGPSPDPSPCPQEPFDHRPLVTSVSYGLGREEGLPVTWPKLPAVCKTFYLLALQETEILAQPIWLSG